MNANNANTENAVEPNIEETSHLSPPCSDVKGRRPKTGRPLSRMECLSDRRLMHINAWLDDGEPFKKLVDLCKSNFEVEIPKTTFQRYYKRSAARTLIADLADFREACAEISKYAVTGVATFSATTLEILEQQAFDLAVAFNRDADAEDLGNLKNLWTLIHKAKNTNIRERHATVQEQKLQLRREELALKRELALARLASENSDAITPTNAAVGAAVPSRPRSRDAMGSTDAVSADPCAQSSKSETKNQQSDHNSRSERLIEGNTLVAGSGSQIEHAPFERIAAPCPLPLEIVIKNRRYAEKLLAGLIDPVTGEERTPPANDTNSSSITAQENGGSL